MGRSKRINLYYQGYQHMKRVQGNLLDLAEAGEFDIIVQGCNCFNTMGGGIAREIREKYSEAYTVDCETERGDILKLGSFTTAFTGKFLIVNAYTQYGFNKAGDTKDVFEYTSFDLILKKLAHVYKNRRFGFPYIGMGLAGGNSTLIIDMLENFSKEVEQSGGSVTLVEFK